MSHQQMVQPNLDRLGVQKGPNCLNENNYILVIFCKRWMKHNLIFMEKTSNSHLLGGAILYRFGKQATLKNTIRVGGHDILSERAQSSSLCLFLKHDFEPRPSSLSLRAQPPRQVAIWSYSNYCKDVQILSKRLLFTTKMGIEEQT